MPHYNKNYRDDDQYVLIAWLIVLFAVVILFLIWHSTGMF